MSPRRGQTLELLADRLDDSGRGTGLARQHTVAVADLLPGERAAVQVEHVSPHQPVAWARLVRRLGPTSPERVSPACPAFGRCGGCAWQHLAYPAQLREKGRRLDEALAGARAAGCRLEVVPAAVVPAPAVLGYRNRGNYAVAPGPDRDIVLGGFAPRSHEVVSTLGCRVVAPAIDAFARQARPVLAQGALQPADPARGTGDLRYLLVRADPRGQLLVTLVTWSRVDPDRVAGTAGALAGLGDVAGVLWMKNDRPSTALFGDPPVLLHGKGTLVETIAGLDIELGPTDFLQVNRDQAERLYRRLAERVGAGPGLRAVDLYCGVGGIAFHLARAGAQVVGIERNPAAVAAARRASDRAGLGRQVEFHAANASEFEALAGASRPGLAVVNPPRKGLDAATRAAVERLAPAVLAYVSCQVDTLARDLSELSTAGWRVAEIHPFDMMPGTAHLETLVVCRRP